MPAETAGGDTASAADSGAGATGGLDTTALLAWAAVSLPIAWGIYITVAKAAILLM